MTKPLLLAFHDTNTLPATHGLKYVLFRLTEGDRFIGYDWGFANYDENGFEELGGSDSPLCKVVMWAEQANPLLLLG